MDETTEETPIISREIVSVHSKIWVGIAVSTLVAGILLLIIRIYQLTIASGGLVNIELVQCALAGPLALFILGSLFGVLMKRQTTLDTSGFTFKDAACDLEAFDSLFEEGVSTGLYLGGSPGWKLIWTVLVVSAIAPGIVLDGLASQLPQDTVLPFVLVIVLIPTTLLFLIGMQSAFRGVSIGSEMASNPLAKRITQESTIYFYLSKMRQCENVASVIMQFRDGKGAQVRTIDEVHAYIITSTEPPLEFEVDIGKMKRYGPVFLIHHFHGVPSLREETIEVDGDTVMVTVDTSGRGSIIRLRYDTNRVLARWILDGTKKTCALLNATIREAKRYQP